MLALALYEAGICECGFHKDLLDPDADFYKIETSTCPLCKSLAAFLRVQAEQERKAVEALGKEPAPEAPRPSDGRRTWIRRLFGDEAEKERARRASRARTPSVRTPASPARSPRR